MSCVLLWHITDHYLYKCNHNISCSVIDQSLYICSSPLQQTTTSVETIGTTTVLPVVSTTKSTTSSTSTSAPVHTSTQLSTTTTTEGPRLITTTHQSPTSTQASQTTRLNLHLNLSTTTETAQTTTHIGIRTTTLSQTQNLTTSPAFIETTTPLSTTSTAYPTTVVNNTTPYIETTTPTTTTEASSLLNETFVNTSTTTLYSPTSPQTSTVIWSTTTAPTTFPTSPQTSTVRRTTTRGPPSTTTIAPTSPSTTSTYVSSTVIMTTTPGMLLTTSMLNITRRKNLRQTGSVDSSHPVLWPLIFLILIIPITLFIIKKRKRQGIVSAQNTVETAGDDAPLDPVIEKILDEQDLKNQLRVNAWRMAKLHKYLKKKHPEKTTLADRMEDNAELMEKIHIQIKKSPVFIYKKRGKKKDTVPTLQVDLVPKQEDIPTMKVDLMTALKEPEKIQHISSVAKLKIKMLPVEYEHRRKRKNFKPLKDSLLPVKPKRPKRKPPAVPKGELDMLKSRKLVSNSVFKN